MNESLIAQSPQAVRAPIGSLCSSSLLYHCQRDGGLLAAMCLGPLLGCATHSDSPKTSGQAAVAGMATPTLLSPLPDFVATPDGMAIAPDGDLVVACPNFADQTKPGCLLR